MLTTDDIKIIYSELVHKEKPSIVTSEANKFRENLLRDMEFAKEMGWVIELPFEIPDIGEKHAKS